MSKACAPWRWTRVIGAALRDGAKLDDLGEDVFLPAVKPLAHPRYFAAIEADMERRAMVALRETVIRLSMELALRSAPVN